MVTQKSHLIFHSYPPSPYPTITRPSSGIITKLPPNIPSTPRFLPIILHTSRFPFSDPSNHCLILLESVHTVLTQPGTPVSFRGMFIYSLFDFWKLRNFRCFPFPENSGTPMFPISRNSGLRCFLLLVICSCISPFTCDSVVSPCFMLLFSLMYSGLSLYPVHTYPTP